MDIAKGIFKNVLTVYWSNWLITAERKAALLIKCQKWVKIFITFKKLFSLKWHKTVKKTNILNSLFTLTVNWSSNSTNSFITCALWSKCKTLQVPFLLLCVSKFVQVCTQWLDLWSEGCRFESRRCQAASPLHSSNHRMQQVKMWTLIFPDHCSVPAPFLICVIIFELFKFIEESVEALLAPSSSHHLLDLFEHLFGPRGSF